MAKLTLKGLRKLRDEKQKTMAVRDPENRESQIIVCMGTCGIAAGAEKTLSAIAAELKDLDITDVTLRQTGCMGLCHSEPTVEVAVKGMPSVIYGNVDAELGKKIVNKHVVNKKMIDNHICDKPAMDIIH